MQGPAEEELDSGFLWSLSSYISEEWFEEHHIDTRTKLSTCDVQILYCSRNTQTEDVAGEKPLGKTLGYRW